MRRARQARMAELGMVFGDDDVELIEGEQWDELSVEMRERAAREMEVYAAMVEEMDRNVGRIIEELTSQGTLEETVILFMSDNGASGSDWSEVRRIFAGMGVGPDLLADFDKANSNPSAIGAQDSFIVYGPQWAQAAMAPFRLYKGYTNEGGIKSAAFVRGPGIVHAQSSDALLSVRDIFPTLLDLAGLRPKASNNAGGARSWSALLSGREGAVRAGDDFIAMEFNGRRMIIRADGWKAVYSSATVRGLGGGTPSWQLFNLRNDPSEVSDLALSRPQILTELVAEWEKYARENNIRADLLKK
ncbi:MAG: sulfatase-like hydrolase/transferase [Parvularculaceae bacterium]